MHESSIFALIAPQMVVSGYSPLPVLPGTKRPAISRWEKYCKEAPSKAFVAGYSRAPAMSVGVACGMGLICIDIDQEEIIAPLREVLPASVVQKKGRKGISLFYRGDTDRIRSKNYRTPERIGLVDLLAEGKQTVLPPSVHPDTGEPYYWITDDTLLDTPLDQLTEIDEETVAAIEEVLRTFGYDPDHERQMTPQQPLTPKMRSSVGKSNMWRETNDKALAHLSEWVPPLHLIRWKKKPGGYEAVAHWRSSGTGRPLELRKRNLSIVSKGIEDFGTGEKYTPIDLVMAARGCDKFAACEWLLERLPQEPLINLRTRKH